MITYQFTLYVKSVEKTPIKQYLKEKNDFNNSKVKSVIEDFYIE